MSTKLGNEERKRLEKLFEEACDHDVPISALRRVLDAIEAPELVEDEKDHVDTFVDLGTKPWKEDEWYARWVLLFMRFPSAWQLAFAEFFGDRKLYCTYNGDRYRVTMASRFGDIGLAPALAPEDSGYEHRVLVKECSDWSDKP